MPQYTEPSFTVAANTSQLGRWLRMSRNRVEEFAAELGVLPAGKKYPEYRLISGLLGLDVSGSAIEPLTHPMMTLAEAATELGHSAQDLKQKVEAGDVNVPPMYVFGERSRRFIRPQIESCSRNPRGRFESFAFLPDYLMSLDDLAHVAGFEPDVLGEIFEGGRHFEPMHVILGEGQKRYIRAHVKTVFKKPQPIEESASELPSPAFCSGVLGQIARSSITPNQS